MTSSAEKKEDREILPFESCVNMHRGERFLVCGTGPSLDQYHRSFYEDFDGVTIGVNDVTGLFTPDYYINIHTRPNLIKCKVPDIDLVFRYRNPSTGIDSDKTGKLSMVGTVALTALTAAYQMGAKEISLIGIDLKFPVGKPSHSVHCVSKNMVDNPPEGVFYSVNEPCHVINCEDELKATVRGFNRAYNQYREQGVKVINLSKDSLLEGDSETAIPC